MRILTGVRVVPRTPTDTTHPNDASHPILIAPQIHYESPRRRLQAVPQIGLVATASAFPRHAGQVQAGVVEWGQ